MKYRGQEYSKVAPQLQTFVERETGKYRGVSLRYEEVKAVTAHPVGQRKYRGVSF